MAKILPHYNKHVRVSFDVDYTLVRLDAGNLIVHQKHVDALKDHWRRGHHVRVHSKGGNKWAKLVVKMLNLEDYVHETVAKDSWYYDDVSADDWMSRIYYKDAKFPNVKIPNDPHSKEEADND